MNNEPSFGTWLKERRQALDLTQNQLAVQVGCTAEMIRKIEAGKRRPSQQVAELLASTLGIATDAQSSFVQFARGTAGVTVDPVAVVGPASPRRPGSLPLAPVALIGRERECAQLADLLRAPKPRLITITGPPGIGKTTLALNVAAAVAGRFSDGAHYVPLAAIRDRTLVAPSVARALGIAASADRPVAEAIYDFLWARSLLLVIDNFEQLLAAAPLVAEMLQQSPRLKILVTSRGALRLRGEKEFALEPLELPATNSLPWLAQLGNNPAVQLFVERAQEARDDFTLTPQNAAAVAEITRRLEGLPLAIELAASHVKLLTPQMMLERLSRRLALLDDGPLDLPERQRTLRGAISWSYDLLRPHEQLLFRRLGVFSGGCTLEAAEAVMLDAGGAGDEFAGVLAELARLVQMSMLRAVDLDGRSRFWMLEMIREFALEQLAAAGELSARREAHAIFFAGFAEAAERELLGANQAQWLDLLEADHDNLRAALHWALDHEQPEIALRMSAALWRFWWVHGHVDEGSQLISAALRVDARGDTGADPLLRARALAGAGLLRREQSDYDEARTLLEESLALRRRFADPVGVADTLVYLGIVAHDQARFAEARALCQEALALAQQQENKLLLSRTLLNMGSIMLSLGDEAEALRLQEWSLELSREIGNRANYATSLHNLGVILHGLGEYNRAQALYEESLAIRRELGNRTRIAAGLSNMGDLLFDAGQQRRGRDLIEEAITLKREVSSRSELAVSLRTLGGMLVDQGEYEDARAPLLEALRLLGGAAAGRTRIAQCLMWLAGAEIGLGRPADAARLLGSVEALYEELQAPYRPLDRARLARIVARGRAILDPEAWTAAWNEGRALPVEEAARLAQAR